MTSAKPLTSKVQDRSIKFRKENGEADLKIISLISSRRMTKIPNTIFPLKTNSEKLWNTQEISLVNCTITMVIELKVLL